MTACDPRLKRVQNRAYWQVKALIDDELYEAEPIPARSNCEPSMSFVRQDVYKAIQENDLDQVVFQDPFTDVTRKSKRNLLVASLVCLLISVLKLQVTGFLGLS